jgi:hypothetical protein
MLQHIDIPEHIEITDDMELLETVHGIESIAKVIETTTQTIQTAQRKGAE